MTLAVSSPTAYAKDTVLKNGGIQYVYNGTTENTHISQGGFQLVSGKAIETYIYDGGVQQLHSSGPDNLVVDERATIYSGGIQRVFIGTSEGATVYGTQIVSAETGSYINNVWTGNGKLVVGAHPALSKDAVINSTGEQIIEYEGSAIGATVDGGKQKVHKTGSIENTKIINGGASFIDAGAQSFGQLEVTNGFVAVETTNNDTLAAANVSLLNSDARLKVYSSTSGSDGDSVYIGNLENNGIVEFTNSAAIGRSRAANDTPITLKVDTLSGDGEFHMRTNIAAMTGDMLEVLESSSGTHALIFNDSASGGYIGTEQLKTVEFSGADQSDNNAVFTSGGVDVGAYVYGLSKYDDGNWYLSPISTSGSDPEASGNDPEAKPKPPLTNAANNAVNFLNANYYLNFVSNQALVQRMGELRGSPEKDGDIWFRSFGGGLDQFSGKRLSGMDMTYYSLQFGADKRIELKGNGDLFVGMMGGYTKGDIAFRVGDGDAEQYHVGAYVSYRHENGFYIDGTSKYIHAKNDFNTETLNGYTVKGNGSSDGYSLSAEAGRRFYKEQIKSGLYVEPQVQLTWSHMGDSTIRSSNGLRTRLGSYDSLLGRSSVILGYSMQNKGNPLDVYIKTGYIKEFDGDVDYVFNGAMREEYSFDSGWWDNGIGMNVQVDNNKNLYLDANYAVGGRFNNWQLNSGYRHQF